MVGCMNAPCVLARRWPPINVRAPCAIASFTWVNKLSSACAELSGAKVVVLSMGSPAAKPCMAALYFFKNSSANASTTIKRFDAVQACPELPMRPATACLTALSRSASSSTMKASLPPSSRVDFFKCLEASVATTAPAASLPVSATARVRRSAITLATWSLEMKRFVYAPAGAPASCSSCSNASAHCGTLDACLTITTLPAIKLGAANRATW